MLSLVSKTEAVVRLPGGRKPVKSQPAGDALIGRVLVLALSSRWQAFGEQLLRTQRRPSEKAVHDLRVSTRRLIALLDIIREILPESDVQKLRRKMKRLLTALSEFRDVQVQIVIVRSLVGRFPILDLHLTVLLVREKLMLKRVRKELESVRVQALERMLIDGREKLEALLLDPTIAEAVRRVVTGVIARRYFRAAALRAGAITGDKGMIHRFRIAFKQFRYSVEALQPILPGVDSRRLKSMNAYQTRMGVIHDSDVLIASVRSHTLRQPRANASEFRALMTHLRRRQEELVGQFMSSSNELEASWRAARATNL